MGSVHEDVISEASGENPLSRWNDVPSDHVRAEPTVVCDGQDVIAEQVEQRVDLCHRGAKVDRGRDSQES